MLRRLWWMLFDRERAAYLPISLATMVILTWSSLCLFGLVKVSAQFTGLTLPARCRYVPMVR